MEKLPLNKNTKTNNQLEESKSSEGIGQEFQSNNPFLGAASPLDNPFAPTQLKSSNPFAPQQQAENPFIVKSTQHLTSADEEKDNPNLPQIKLQTQLNVGTNNDKYEQEANKIAKQIVNEQAVSEVNQNLNSTTQLKGEPHQNHATVESQLNKHNDTGTPMPKELRQPMEEKFGTDFSNVKIHTDSNAVQLNQQLNARAFTTGQDIYFNQGEFTPQSDDGAELLAHELTHVVQQNSNNIQRKVIQKQENEEHKKRQDNIIISEGSVKLNIKKSKELYPAATRILIMYPGKLEVYNAAGEHLIQEFSIDKSIEIPPFYFASSGRQFYIAIEDLNTKTVIFPGIDPTIKPSPEQEKIIADLNYALTTGFWFEDDKTSDTFHKLIQGQPIILTTNNASAGGQTSAGKKTGGDDVPLPPKPKWASSFEKELNQLITQKKNQEPTATDLPDMFSVYYGKKTAKWYGGAAQGISKETYTNRVHLLVNEGEDKEKYLQNLRTKIRIEMLKGEKDTLSKEDAKALEPEMLWAYELKAKVEALINQAKKTDQQRIDLPDKITLVSTTEKEGGAYLKVFAYVKTVSPNGEEAKQELKSGTLPQVLSPKHTPEELFSIVTKATLALKGLVKAPQKEKPANAKQTDRRVLAPYPAEIIAKDVRPDAKTVSGGTQAFDMKLNYAAFEQTLLGQTTSAMQPIYYTWDIYNVAEQLSNDEYAKLPTEWEQRRATLKKIFYANKQVKGKPVVNQTALKNWNRFMVSSPEITQEDLNKAENINQFKTMGILYGAATYLTPEATLEMPEKKGDYLIHCRALVEPTDDTYRLPSNQFFPIRVEDGYELAQRSVDSASNDIKDLEKSLEKIKTDKTLNEEEKAQFISQIEAKIIELKNAQGIPLKERNKAQIKDAEQAVQAAKKLKTIVIAAKGEENATTFGIAKEKHEATRLLMNDLWLMLSFAEPNKAMDKKIDELIANLEKQLTSTKDLDTRLGSFDKDFKKEAKSYTPIISFISKTTGQEYTLITTVAESKDSKDGKTEVILLDVTTKSTQKKYYGESNHQDKTLALKEAVMNAFVEFGQECKYGEGYIAYRVPGLIEEVKKIPSKPGPIQQVKSVLSAVAMVAGLAALVVGTVATGGALAVAATAVGVGAGVVGAGLAIDNIYDRAQNNRLEADVELAMDIMSILGPVLSGAKILTTSKLAKASGQLGKLDKLDDSIDALSKTKKAYELNNTIIIAQRAELVTNIALFSYKVKKDLNDIANSPDLTPEQKDAMRTQIIKNAVVAGVMFAVAIKNELKPSLGETEALAKRRITAAEEAHYEQLKLKNKLTNEQGELTTPEGKTINTTDAAATSKGTSEELDAPQVDKNPAPESKPNKQPTEDTPAKTPEAEVNDAKKAPTDTDIDTKKPADAETRTPEGEPIKPETQKPTTITIKNRRQIVKRANDEAKANAIKELVQKHGDWKDLMLKLSKQDPEVAKQVLAYRDRHVQRIIKERHGQLLSGASTDPTSDVDISFGGVNAGKQVIDAEAALAQKWGPNWSKDWRMNFYTEVRRLNIASEVGDLIGDAASASLNQQLTALTQKYSLAKMLRHAMHTPNKQHKAKSMQRVEDLIKKAGGNLEELKKIASISDADSLQKRNELMLEIDTKIKEYDRLDATDPKRAVLAKEISEKQIEANFHTEEAYLGAGAIRAMQGPEGSVVTGSDDSVQGVLANLEMIEHIIAQHGGDITKAGKEYEIYKYMQRIMLAMGDPQRGMFSDRISRFVNQKVNKKSVNREAPKNFTENEIKLYWEDFMYNVDKFISSEMAKPKPTSPTPSPVPQAQDTGQLDFGF